MTKPLTPAQLQKIIARWDDGSGVTAAVQAFAQAVPVAERTVWYWIGGLRSIAYGDAQTWPSCSSREVAKQALKDCGGEKHEQ